MNDFVFVETIGYVNRSNVTVIGEPVKLNSDGNHKFTIYFNDNSEWTVRKNTKDECEVAIRRIVG